MSKSRKYYVVWRGHKSGIYHSWEECKAQVDGYEGAQYKSFSQLAEAETAFKNSYWNYVEAAKKILAPVISRHKAINRASICVDAACSGNPGVMEYRGVDTTTGQEIFRKGPYQDGTNNIGEFLAIVHGIAYLIKSNSPIQIIYSDSVSAIAWVRNKKIKTTLERTEKNNELFEIMKRAENYLLNTEHSFEIRKWETENWGEIPADFGRK